MQEIRILSHGALREAGVIISVEITHLAARAFGESDALLAWEDALLARVGRGGVGEVHVWAGADAGGVVEEEGCVGGVGVVTFGAGGFV